MHAHAYACSGYIINSVDLMKFRSLHVQLFQIIVGANSQCRREKQNKMKENTVRSKINIPNALDHVLSKKKNKKIHSLMFIFDLKAYETNK